VPPAVQATVFRTTALIPGVNVGKAADALGRAALALSGAGLAGGLWRGRPVHLAAAPLSCRYESWSLFIP
jgi:hypothetical protein